MHQLIVDKQNTEAAQLKRSFASTIAAVARTVPDSLLDEQLASITPEIPHIIETATNCQNWLQDDDLIWPFVGLGRFYTRQGAYAVALSWYEQCLAIVRDLLNQDYKRAITESTPSRNIK